MSTVPDADNYTAPQYIHMFEEVCNDCLDMVRCIIKCHLCILKIIGHSHDVTILPPKVI